MAVAAIAATLVSAHAPSHLFRVKSGWSGEVFWLAFEESPSEQQLYDEVLSREQSLSADVSLFKETLIPDNVARAERDAMRRSGKWVPPESDFTSAKTPASYGDWSLAGATNEWSKAEFRVYGGHAYVRVARTADQFLDGKDPVGFPKAVALTPFESGMNLSVNWPWKEPTELDTKLGFKPDPPIEAIWLTEPSTRIEFPPFATRTVYFVVTLFVGIIAAFLTTKLIGYLINSMIFTLVAAGLLLAALAPIKGYGEHAHSVLPSAYFEVLRCAVCGAACYGAFKLKTRHGWLWAMVGVAVLFNPIVPARLSREAWQVVDAAGGIFFFASISQFKKRRHLGVDASETSPIN
jgi:hypothetical protein